MHIHKLVTDWPMFAEYQVIGTLSDIDPRGHASMDIISSPSNMKVVYGKIKVYLTIFFMFVR